MNPSKIADLIETALRVADLASCLDELDTVKLVDCAASTTCCCIHCCIHGMPLSATQLHVLREARAAYRRAKENVR